MIGIAASVFLASLLGSVHCAGMCGGFVCFYAGTDGRAGAASHGAYSVGRLISYLALGLVAGVLGTAVDTGGDLLGLRGTAAVVSGVLMIGWGIATIAEQRGLRLPLPSLLAPAQGWIARRVHALRERPATQRAFLTGLFTTLLPCGWLYAFVVTAGGSGRVGSALLLMTVFWLGTLPMMVALGAGVRRLSGPLRQRLPLFSAAAIVLVGIVTLFARAGEAPHRHAIPAAVESTATVQPAAATSPSEHDHGEHSS